MSNDYKHVESRVRKHGTALHAEEEEVKPRFVLLRILCQEHTYLRFVSRLSVKHDLEGRHHCATHRATLQQKIVHLELDAPRSRVTPLVPLTGNG